MCAVDVRRRRPLHWFDPQGLGAADYHYAVDSSCVKPMKSSISYEVKCVQYSSILGVRRVRLRKYEQLSGRLKQLSK